MLCWTRPPGRSHHHFEKRVIIRPSQETVCLLLIAFPPPPPPPSIYHCPPGRTSRKGQTIFYQSNGSRHVAWPGNAPPVNNNDTQAGVYWRKYIARGGRGGDSGGGGGCRLIDESGRPKRRWRRPRFLSVIHGAFRPKAFAPIHQMASCVCSTTGH